MNKTAQQQIVRDFYNAGVQLALREIGMEKNASPLKYLLPQYSLAPAMTTAAGLMASAPVTSMLPEQLKALGLLTIPAGAAWGINHTRKMKKLYPGMF